MRFSLMSFGSSSLCSADRPQAGVAASTSLPAEGCRPPRKVVEQHVGGGSPAAGSSGRPSASKLRDRPWKLTVSRMVVAWSSANTCAEVLDGAQAAGQPAVGHERHGLACHSP